MWPLKPQFNHEIYSDRYTTTLISRHVGSRLPCCLEAHLTQLVLLSHIGTLVTLLNNVKQFLI